MSGAREQAVEHPTRGGKRPPAKSSVVRQRKNALLLANKPEAAALKTRSAVTNGRRLHVVRPGDTAWSRRFKDVLSNIVSDLGGFDTLSEGQKQLARRCALISIECERMEGQAASGVEIDLESYGQ